MNFILGYRMVKPVNFLIFVAICFRFSCISRFESRLRFILGAPFSSESLFAACTVVIETLLRALLLCKVEVFKPYLWLIIMTHNSLQPCPAIIKLFGRFVIKSSNIFRCNTIHLTYCICSFRSCKIIIVHPHVVNHYHGLKIKLSGFWNKQQGWIKQCFGTNLSKRVAHEYSGNDYGACHDIVLEKKLFKNLHCWKIDKCEHE